MRTTLRTLKRGSNTEVAQKNTVLWAVSCVCFFFIVHLSIADDSNAAPSVGIKVKPSRCGWDLGWTDQDLCPIAALLSCIARGGDFSPDPHLSARATGHTPSAQSVHAHAQAENCRAHARGATAVRSRTHMRCSTVFRTHARLIDIHVL